MQDQKMVDEINEVLALYRRDRIAAAAALDRIREILRASGRRAVASAGPDSKREPRSWLAH